MRKYLSMVALAIASVMVFTSCHREKTEYLDPDAPSGGSDDSKQVLDIEIDASISGAMTKGVSMTIKYTDFDGKSDEVVLNKDFAGQSPLSLKLPFHAQGKGKEFAISVTTTKADITAYKTEKAPWNASCIINVKHNGKEDFQHSVKVTENPISESMTMFDVNYDAPKYFCSGVYYIFEDKTLCFKIDDNNQVVCTKK